MIARALTLAFMLGGAAFCSQYPAFTQQYLQRLGGQVDALSAVVADFESSAMRAGLTRSQALEQMTGTPFLDNRQADMRATFRRHAVLSDNLAHLRAASPVARIMMVQRVSDPATLAGTWADFEPAMPLSFAGMASAALGAVLGWLLAALGRGALGGLWSRPKGRPVERRRKTAPSAARSEPVLAGGRRPAVSPRLAGVRRDR
ncbi:DUF2937 family protein [Salipiger sp. IMCC34102]|uniref:DUF2937 family protein n=1 Tax=Salipiger sp. IMCC34102 TaxID=2510647 RepID=UPI00101D94CD|nr:DUF2937 family protein [Salipiger sp. IMCC34102]RYH01818.1 DUF2937 family protein [Salipiger sp. IMCC34102]